VRPHSTRFRRLTINRSSTDGTSAHMHDISLIPWHRRLPNGHLTSQEDEVLIGAPQDVPTFTPCYRQRSSNRAHTVWYLTVYLDPLFDPLPGVGRWAIVPPTQYRRALSFRRPSIITAPASDILKNVNRFIHFVRQTQPRNGKSDFTSHVARI
jgi:hypothetical protein